MALYKKELYADTLRNNTGIADTSGRFGAVVVRDEQFPTVDVNNSTPTQLVASQAGSLVGVSSINANSTINLPLLASVPIGANYSFLVATNANFNLTISKHASDSACIIGGVGSASAAIAARGAQSATAISNFIITAGGAQNRGDCYTFTKITAALWFFEGYTVDATKISFS